MTARVTKRQVDALIEEIVAYLGAVDSFRAEGCEPEWRAGAVQPPAAVVAPRKEK
jgi:hypothetical protein